MLTGCAISSISSVTVGAACYATPAVFIIGRVGQGVGAGMTLSSAALLLHGVYPSSWRKEMAYSFFAVSAPLGWLAGAGAASALTQARWPIVYWTFAVVMAGIGALAYFVVPVPPLSIWNKGPGLKKEDQQNSLDEKVRKATTTLDVPGMITFVFSVILLNVAWIQGTVADYSAPYVWLSLLAGSVLLGVFVILEMYYATQPLLPVRALTIEAMIVLSAIVCGSLCAGAWMLYIWQFLEVIRNVSAILVLTTIPFLPPSVPLNHCYSYHPL
jgi:MFS family permease